MHCLYKKEREEYLQKWKLGLEKGWYGKTCAISKILRDFLLKKYNYKCCKCGWDKVNPVTKKVPLEVNHIDGVATNCKEENLEILCPNCHSLTPNFRSLNKKSPRNRK